jgi:uncharacterized membrane protein
MAGGRPWREGRWPPALALLVLVLLSAAVPAHLALGARWLLPTITVIGLVALIAVDPERNSRRVSADRVLTIGLTVLLIVAATIMTYRLVRDLILGGLSTTSGTTLLYSGALVWAYNNILFGLLYWELDAGGPAERARDAKPFGGLAFPQQMNPHLAPEGWRPIFGDYLYLGLTNALAFSPTDVMPFALWAKATMALQSLISFVMVGLVIARAVNVLI